MAKQDGEGKATDFLTWVPTERIPGTWFRLLRFIDEGGHGRLYQVEHEITGRVCAFKAIHRRFRTFAHLEARLRQEANVNTRLSGHPNIAEVFDAGVTEDGRTYCVMQWLEGTSLRNVLKHGMGLDVDWACFVVKSVLSALARAHSLGIVHRDIKPANIFLCDDGLVKLIDFGIAKVFNSKFIKTDPLLLPCTYQYMSPESADGQDVTSSSDLYSLGVVFWEMLAGEHPFQRYTLPKDVVLAIVRDGVPPLDNMPKAVARTTAALRQVVMRACAQEPSERFPSAEAFFEAIDVAMGYAAPPQPIASGFRPPASLARSAAPKPPSSPRTLPSASYGQRTPSEHLTGTAPEVPAAPTPRVGLTDQAAQSLSFDDTSNNAADQARPARPENYSSSVRERGPSVDTGAMPPLAPWLSARSEAPSGGGRSDGNFGILSHIPPLGARRAELESAADRTPSSTPPLVSATRPRADVHPSLADVDASDEATTLPMGAGAAADARDERRAPPLRRAAERLRAFGRAGRTPLAGAGALAIVGMAFALGRVWSVPAGRGPAARAGSEAGSEGLGELRAPLSPAPPPVVSAPVAADAALVASPSFPPPATEPAPSAPSAPQGEAPKADGARTTKRETGPAPRSEAPRGGARRDPSERPTSRALSAPARLPKGGIDPGFLAMRPLVRRLLSPPGLQARWPGPFARRTRVPSGASPRGKGAVTPCGS